MKFKDLFRFRAVWMGIAIILVVLFHYKIIFQNTGVFSAGIFTFFWRLGYSGVDIFVFASGIGCYYSYEKLKSLRGGEDICMIDFMKNRMKKLLPAWFLFLPFWIASKYILEDFDLRAVVGNVFFLQFFTRQGKAFNWYVSAMWVFYFLTPYIHVYLKKAGSLKMAAAVALSIISSIPFLSNADFLIMMTRIPLFVIGMIFADISFRTELISKKIIYLLLCLMILGTGALFVVQKKFMSIAMTYGLGWYPLILITPGLCIIISWLSSFAENKKVISVPFRLLQWLGKYTFEIYLLHLLIMETVYRLDVNKTIDKGSLLIQAASVIALVPLTILLCMGEKAVKNLFVRAGKKAVE